MKNLFTYGTLMCEDIMIKVSGCHPSHDPATLRGYQRRFVTGAPYPAVIPHREAAVNGLVYRNVPDSAWHRLDRFEGEMYERHHVIVELSDRTTLPADVYVIHPAYVHCLDERDWDVDDFIKNNKARFKGGF